AYSVVIFGIQRDKKMKIFIRPSTLFRPGNFEDYLNEAYEDPKKIIKTGQLGVSRKNTDTRYPMLFLSNVYKHLRKQGKDNPKYSKLLFALTDEEAKQASIKYNDSPADFIEFLERK
ncbi:hypothetical protein LCGC14_2563110, partial [marine sediment metagenome]